MDARKSTSEKISQLLFFLKNENDRLKNEVAALQSQLQDARNINDTLVGLLEEQLNAHQLLLENNTLRAQIQNMAATFSQESKTLTETMELHAQEKNDDEEARDYCAMNCPPELLDNKNNTNDSLFNNSFILMPQTPPQTSIAQIKQEPQEGWYFNP